jgi:hypothetical protein
MRCRVAGCRAYWPPVRLNQRAPAVSGRTGSETIRPVPAAEKSAGSAAAAKPAGKIPSGFRRETRNGKELFCRQSTMSGSRFPTEKTCFTREQLEDVRRDKESTMDGVGQGDEPCPEGTSCDNGT